MEIWSEVYFKSGSTLLLETSLLDNVDLVLDSDISGVGVDVTSDDAKIDAVFDEVFIGTRER